MKEYSSQALKFTITDDALKMEISLKDLVWLFENSPNNTYDGETVAATVKKDKVQDFAKFIVESLMDETQNDSGDTVWGQPFEEAFEKIFEGYEDFCEYSNDDGS